MGMIEQPWNCPHGRPTMRHLVDLESTIRSEREIDWARLGWPVWIYSTWNLNADLNSFWNCMNNDMGSSLYIAGGVGRSLLSDWSDQTLVSRSGYHAQPESVQPLLNMLVFLRDMFRMLCLIWDMSNYMLVATSATDHYGLNNDVMP